MADFGAKETNMVTVSSRRWSMAPVHEASHLWASRSSRANTRRASCKKPLACVIRNWAAEALP